jgi:hypothetical protein
MTERNIAVPQSQKTDVDKLIRILAVLKGMNHEPSAMAQWTPDGRPDPSYVSDQLGELITMNDIAEAAPEFRRVRHPSENVDDQDSAEPSATVSAVADTDPQDLFEQARIAEQLRADSLVEITVLRHRLAQAQNRQQAAIVEFQKNDPTRITPEQLRRQFIESENWLRAQRAAGVRVDHQELPCMDSWTVEEKGRFFSTPRGANACNTASAHQTMSRQSMWKERAKSRIFGGV